MFKDAIGALLWTVIFLVVLVCLWSVTRNALAHDVPNTVDVCRIDNDPKVVKTYCQHWRGGVKQDRRLRSKATHNNWMAIPCAQLKKLVPALDCKKSMGEIRFGERQEKSK